MPPLLQLVTDLLLFVVVVAGLGVPLLAATKRLAPSERLVAGIGAGLLAVYACAFVVFALRLPRSLLWLLPAIGVLFVTLRRDRLRELFSDQDTRLLLSTFPPVALWCLCFTLLIQSYSGGGWSGDWMEHYERSLFFLLQRPADTLFIQYYPLTARPPLANLVTGALLGLGEPTFARYQLFSCLLNALAFLPTVLVARDLGADRRASAGLALLFMLNPLFVQNTSFAWTKLVTAFFVVLAAHFLLNDTRGKGGGLGLPLAGIALAAGALAHYSAGVWIVAFGAAWLLTQARRLKDGRMARNLFAGLVGGAAVLATWFAWSLSTYGWRTTFGTTTSVTAGARLSLAELAATAWGNTLDTLVPHSLRTMDRALIEQGDSAAALRDWFFNIYQLDLPLALGTAGAAWLLVHGLRHLVAPAGAAQKDASDMPVGSRRFVAIAAILSVLLGAGTHTIRDQWGLTHISLQPFVLLALAWLAARALPWLRHASPSFKAICAAAVFVDFALGIALHFGVQSFFLQHLLHPDLNLLQLVERMSPVAQGNFWGMVRMKSPFLGESLDLPQPLTGLLLVCLFAVVWRQARGNASAG